LYAPVIMIYINILFHIYLQHISNVVWEIKVRVDTKLTYTNLRFEIGV